MSGANAVGRLSHPDYLRTHRPRGWLNGVGGTVHSLGLGAGRGPSRAVARVLRLGHRAAADPEQHQGSDEAVHGCSAKVTGTGIHPGSLAIRLAYSKCRSIGMSHVCACATLRE